MNYFELYKLPISFNIDEKALKNKFYELSKKYHPDLHTAESEEQQNEVLQLSSLNNTAYKTLQNTESRIQYTLELLGTLKKSENYQLPQSFLMEMMELNEQLMEMNEPSKVESFKNDINQKLDEINEHLKLLFAQFDLSPKDSSILEEIKRTYLCKKYFLRLVEKSPIFARL